MGVSGDQKGAETRLASLLRRQDGVVARRQVIAVFPGVYVTHTGELTRRQQEWAVAPAALSHESAIIAAGGVGLGYDDRPLRVVVPTDRHVLRPPGVGFQYSAFFDERVTTTASPPRVRLEHAVLDVAGAAPSDFAAIACLAGVVQGRLTTPDRLLEVLASRSRTGRRRFLESVLIDVRDGACSVLENRYLNDVERPHGLPPSIRQSETGVGRHGFRDVEYEEWGVIVELDGRLYHDGAAARDADLERDLDAAVFAVKDTVRLGWCQTVDRACRTARKVGIVLNNHGWPGTTTPCGPGCPAGSHR